MLKAKTKRLSISKLRDRILDYIAIILLLNVRWFFFAFDNNSVLYAIKYGFFGIIIVRFLKKGKISKELIYLFVLFASVFLVTLLNGDSVYQVLQRYVPIIAVFVLITNNKNRLDDFLYNTYTCLEIIIYINLICLLLFPAGMNKTGYTINWFIGQKQDFAMAFLPALVIGALYCEIRIKKPRFLILVGAMLFQAITHLALGLVISFLSFGICYFALKLKKKTNFKALLIINAILQLLLLIMISSIDQFTLLTRMLSSITTGSLNKLDTFLIRILLWKDSLAMFFSSPIVGNGIASIARSNLFVNAGVYYPNFHGLFFDLLATSGMIGVFYFIHLNYSVSKKVSLVSNEKYYVLAAGVFSINVFFLTEALYSPLLFLIYFISLIEGKVLCNSTQNRGRLT